MSKNLININIKSAVNRLLLLIVSVLFFSCNGDNSSTIVNEEESGQNEDEENIVDSDYEDEDNTVDGNDIDEDEDEQSVIIEADEEFDENKTNEADEDVNLEVPNEVSSSVRDFINHIYKSKILFKRKCECFTNGSFVFEDNDGKLFDLLAGNCSKTRSIGKEIITKYEEGAINNISLNPYYTKLRRNPILCGTFDIDKKIWSSKRMSMTKKDTGPLKHFYRYEYELGCPLEFLCDPQCASKSTKCEKPSSCNTKKPQHCVAKKNKCCKCHKCCSNKQRDQKRIITFFRFKTRPWSACRVIKPNPCDNGKCGVNRKIKQEKSHVIKTYIFIKLEKDRKVSMGKLGDAFNKPFEKHTYHSRKENEKLKVNLHNEKNRLLMNITDENEKSKASHSTNFYNKKLRTGNEMFVPQEITNMLLEGYSSK